MYTGTLWLVETRGNAAILRMPPDAVDGAYYYASWAGLCGTEVSVPVMCESTPCCTYDFVAVWNACMPAPAPYANSMVYVINYGTAQRDCCMWNAAPLDGGCSSSTVCGGIGQWIALYPWSGAGNAIFETRYFVGIEPRGCRHFNFADNPSVYCN